MRDGRTPHERLKGKSAKVQGMTFAEGTTWEEETGRGHLGVKATTGEIIVANRGGMWLTRRSGVEQARRCRGAEQSGQEDTEHPEDPERADGKWKRAERNKRKAGDVSEACSARWPNGSIERECAVG